MTQAESKAAVSAGVQQEQLEAEERRRSVVLLLLSLAAAILVFWLGVFGLVPGAAFSASAAPVGGFAGGNVVLVGYNGSQKFFVWAPPGLITQWDVAFCNVAGRRRVCGCKGGGGALKKLDASSST
jgi:hypothetical protein